nr:P27 family phage terminase small subunit [Clostridium neonatale]DAO99750.1 MAG TPA: terminase small subunit [Caudoviricetes sp.]
MILNENEKVTNYEKAEVDYISGMTYKKIAEKYSVSINTVKSWKKRYKWTRDCTTKEGCNKKRVQALGNNLYDDIKADLLKQLEANGSYGKHYEDLINDYMELWNTKNKLFLDIKERGVSIEWSNGKQFSIKKNDSIGEVNRTSAQMLKILDTLRLVPPKIQEDDDYDI